MWSRCMEGVPLLEHPLFISLVFYTNFVQTNDVPKDKLSISESAMITWLSLTWKPVSNLYLFSMHVLKKRTSQDTKKKNFKRLVPNVASAGKICLHWYSCHLRTF